LQFRNLNKKGGFMLTQSLKIPTNPEFINLDSFISGSNEIRFIDVIELINNRVSRDDISRWLKRKKEQSKKRFIIRVPDPYGELGVAGVDILA